MYLYTYLNITLDFNGYHKIRNGSCLWTKGKEAEENNVAQLNLQCSISYGKPEVKNGNCLRFFILGGKHTKFGLYYYYINLNKKLKKLKPENLLELSQRFS